MFPPIKFFSLVILLSVTLSASTDTYNVVKEFAGPTFFDDWTYYDHFDNLTNGDVIFVSKAVGESSQLTFVDPTTNHAIIKVDNTSNVVFNDKRNTVRITTNDSYSVGSVWAADMLHVPYGCSVWPAWWSQASAWPVGGEIDTFEGVNLGTLNQMSLHTEPNCTVVGQNQTSTLLNSTDCSFDANSNQGCITTDPRTTAYGAAFAQAGGGVFVTEFAETGISIWFFPRADVPTALSSNSSSLDTSTLGVPVGNWPATDCASNTFFSAQHLIFDITLCGDFAGAPNIFAETCPGTCYPDYVVGNGTDYANAYFEIASVRVFSKAGTNTASSNSNSSWGLLSKGKEAAVWSAVMGALWLMLA